MNDNTEQTYLGVVQGGMGTQFGTGIYYLLRGNRVVYIGQSTCIINRVSNHFVARKKRFDRFTYMNAPTHMLNELELKEIITYNPEYNKSLPRNNIYASMGMLKARFRKTGFELRDIIKANGIGSMRALGRKYYYLHEFNGILKPVRKEQSS